MYTTLMVQITVAEHFSQWRVLRKDQTRVDNALFVDQLKVQIWQPEINGKELDLLDITSEKKITRLLQLLECIVNRGHDKFFAL